MCLAPARLASEIVPYIIYEAHQLIQRQQARWQRFCSVSRIHGTNYHLDPDAVIGGIPECNMTFGDGVIIRHNAWLYTDGNYGSVRLVLGRAVYIGPSSTVYCAGGDIVIGDDTIIAGLVTLISGNHAFDRLSIPIRLQGVDVSKVGIRLGRDVWIGANAVVLPGVTIGDGAIVGAGSVVTSSLPPYSVSVGSPARVIQYRQEPPISRDADIDLVTLQAPTAGMEQDLKGPTRMPA